MAAIPSTVEASQELLLSELPEQSSLGQDAWRRLKRNRLAVVGLAISATLLWSAPDRLVALVLVVLLGRGLFNILLAIALTGWLGMARLVRGQTLSIREREYVEAARTIGTPNVMILSRHILPNALGPIIVQATYLVPAAIIFQAFLSLLGLRLPPPAP